jgi:hypothetical protein
LAIGSAFVVGCSNTTTADLIGKGDAIRYLIDKTEPAEWQQPRFDDSLWLKAAGVIGPLAADPAGVMAPVLTRSHFDLGARAQSYRSLVMRLDVPGTFTAFVNGVAMLTAPDSKSAVMELPPGLVHESNNTLAIALHPPADVSEVVVAPLLEGAVDESNPGPPHVVRGPWLVGPRPDGITIQWETSQPSSSQAVVDGKIFDGGSGTHHSARIDGLLPSHSYPYHVTVGEKKSPESELMTAPGERGERVKFVVYGDNRTNGDVHRLVAQGIDAEGPDFVLNTGDLVDVSSPREWQTFFDIEYDLLRHIPIFPTLGNHEESSGGSARFAELFPLGNNALFEGKVYGYDFGDVHIAVLDSNGSLAQQAVWLEDDLKEAESRGARHSFIMMHHGPWSGGTTIMHGSNKDAQKYIVPVARRHNVSAMFAGHDHFYERGGDDGLIYFVAGGGGAPLHGVSKLPQTRVAHSRHHYLVVEVLGPSVTFTAKDPAGNAFDSHTFVRN